VKWLIAIAVLVAACAGPAEAVRPSEGVLAATSRPAPSSDPCPAAISGLSTFTKALREDVGAIREPLKATPFVASDVAVASFRVSAMLTTFRTDELVGVVAQCPATAALAGRVTKLVKAMNEVLDGARAASITNATAQREAANALVGMLDEVAAISTANDQAAASLGGGTAAGGSPAPSGAGSPGAGASASPGTDWTIAANAYLEDTFATYATAVGAAADLRQLDPAAAGLSSTEAATRQQQAAALVDRAATAVSRHLEGLQGATARPCYSDARDADRTVATSWQQLLLADGPYPGDATAESRAAAAAFAETEGRTASFLGSMRSYFADCH
jgi:hypothetical protein